MSTTSSPQRSMPLPSADTASGLSHFFLYWVAPLVLKGSRKRLTRADVPDCPEKLRSDVADNIYEQAEAAWNAEVEHARTAGRTPSVVRGPARCVAGRYFWMGQSLTGLSGLLVTLVRPMLLRALLRSLPQSGGATSDSGSLATAYGLAVALAVCAWLENHVRAIGAHYCGEVGNRRSNSGPPAVPVPAGLAH